MWYLLKFIKIESNPLSISYKKTIFHVLYENRSIPDTTGRPKTFELNSTENYFITINNLTGELYGTPKNLIDKFNVTVKCCRGVGEENCEDTDVTIETKSILIFI